MDLGNEEEGLTVTVDQMAISPSWTLGSSVCPLEAVRNSPVDVISSQCLLRPII